MKSKFSECPDFSCSRSEGTLEPVTSSFPAVSESLRANSQSSTVVQSVRPLSRSFSLVRVQSGKTRYHSAYITDEGHRCQIETFYFSFKNFLISVNVVISF